MSKPIIAVSLAYYDVQLEEENKYHVKGNYIEAIKMAGGIPLLIPILEKKDVEKLLNNVSGILLTGGGGLLPHVDKNQLPSLYEQNPVRHEFDRWLVEYGLERQLPLMGICRGMQVINEVLGGTLYHDLRRATGEEHLQELPGSTTCHPVILTKDSRFYKTFQNEKIEVNSFHSQSIKSLAKGLKSVAVSEEGIVEAVENERAENQFISGFQFHPEMLLATNKKFLKVFDQFIEAAAKDKSEEKDPFI